RAGIVSSPADDRFCWDCHDAKGSPANSLHQVREICWAAPELVDEVLRGLVYRHELRTREGTNHDICGHWIRVSVSRFRRHSPRASHGRRGKPRAEGRCFGISERVQSLTRQATPSFGNFLSSRAGGKASAAVNVLGFQEGREFAANAEAVRVQTLARRRLRTAARPGRLVAAEASVKIGRRGS